MWGIYLGNRIYLVIVFPVIVLLPQPCCVPRTGKRKHVGKGNVMGKRKHVGMMQAQKKGGGNIPRPSGSECYLLVFRAARFRPACLVTGFLPLACFLVPASLVACFLGVAGTFPLPKVTAYTL